MYLYHEKNSHIHGKGVPQNVDRKIRVHTNIKKNEHLESYLTESSLIIITNHVITAILYFLIDL